MVDDAHVADLPSLRFLCFLARRLDGLAVTLVCAGRVGEVASADALLDVLKGRRGVSVLRPLPLTESAAGRLIQATTGARPAREFVVARAEVSGGSPFLLRELIDALTRDAIAPTAQAAPRVLSSEPETVSRAVLLRLSQLPVTASALAQGVGDPRGGRATQAGTGAARLDGPAGDEAIAALVSADRTS